MHVGPAVLLPCLYLSFVLSSPHLSNLGASPQSHNAPILSWDPGPPNAATSVWTFLGAPAPWLCWPVWTDAADLTMQQTWLKLSPGVAFNLLIFPHPFVFLRLLASLTVHLRSGSFQGPLQRYSFLTLRLSYARLLKLSRLQIAVKCNGHQMLLLTIFILWKCQPRFSYKLEFVYMTHLSH